MAHIKQIFKTKLVIGIMYSDKEAYEEAIKQLEQKFGEISDKSQEYDFNFTTYYEEETGKDLKKQIIVFKKLIDRDELAEIKHYTNTIEDEFSKEGKRKINLDPGYMTEHNVILASAKELPHKVSIGKGMFGDVVLEYRKGDYEDSRHTFPDYRTPLVKEFLKTIRKKYLQERK
jgi:hypothetical protein